LNFPLLSIYNNFFNLPKVNIIILILFLGKFKVSNKKQIINKYLSQKINDENYLVHVILL